MNTLGGRVDTKAGIIHRRGAGETETRNRRLPIRIPRCLSGFLGRWDAAEYAGTSLKMIEDRERPPSSGVSGRHHIEDRKTGVSVTTERRVPDKWLI
ncbi:hypothetical protein [Nitratireductor kimnyeongensis]|uniref:hypothetical protein n=1 Tax=Nitratireductor kimnyeongensis TaxID=430679 RepID=UPI00366A8389